MKKQINPTVKAHLIRSAFYVILLLAVCVIPFALAQRNTTRHSVAKPKMAANTKVAATGKQATGAPASSGAVGTAHAPPQRKAPAVQRELPYDVHSAPANALKFPYSTVRDRNTPTTSRPTGTAKRISQAPLKFSGPTGTHTFRILPQPRAPKVVLYDQYDNGSGAATSSQDFEAANDPFDSFNADDFVVPAGQTWNITEVDAQGAYFNGAGPADSFHVFIYQDAGGLPGTLVYSATNQPYTGGPTDFVINLGSPAVLSEGTYWVSVQCRMDFSVGGQWGFMDRTVQANSPAAWQNPGGGFGICPTWGYRGDPAGCNIDPGVPDQVFRLVGTTGGGGGCTDYTATASTGTITPGDTDSGNHCDDCTTTIALPFPASVYGQTFNTADVASNGTLNLVGSAAPFTHGCLTLPNAFWEMAILPFQDDLRTDNLGFAGCAGYPGGNCGVFTSVTGTAPNRQFNIEWRAVHFSDTTAPANFEVVFYENNSSFWDVFYGVTTDNGIDETSGVQASSSGPATTFSCGEATLTDGLKVTYTCAGVAPTPTPTPSPTCIPGAGGLLVGSGLTTGFPGHPDNWPPIIAGDTVNYTFANSQAAPNEFALFETHDPWGGTIVKDAITGNGHTFTEFTPNDLAGFDFSQYRVVILNWDDTFLSDFNAQYSAAIPALEAYINAGGVVWVQAAIQGSPGDNYPMPFGGQGNGADFGSSDPIVDPANPMVIGAPNPLNGNSASHVSYSGLPGASHVVVTKDDPAGPPTLYELFPGGGGCTPTPSPTPTCTPSGGWSEVAPYPFAARGPFVVSDGTSYYVGGGYDGNNVHNELFLYDPVANTYTPLAGAPDQFFLSQAVIDSGKIYSIAGFNLGGQSTTTRIYDIAGNSWTTGAPIPEPNGLSDAATGLDSGKIYIAGGFNGSGAGNTLHIYDIATDSWTTGAAMPTAVYLPGFGAINGKFYVASGNNGATEVPDLQIYDIATDTWTTGAPIPTPVTGPGSTVFNGKLYVFGGTAPFPVTTTITQIYDPATNSWSAGPGMVLGKLWFYGGALDDSSVLAPGGDDSNIFPTNDVQILGGGGGPCGSPSPTATPSCTPIVVNGSIDTGDPTQLDRLFRSGFPQTCPASTSCATFGDPTPRHYDEYTFTNTTGATQCVTIDTNTACTGTNFIFIAAYLGSFDPNNICTNWIGDSGFSPNPDQPFQVNVDNGQTMVVVVSEVTPDAGCPGYTVTITGLCGGGITPTPTPTPSATATATPTPTPTATPSATATATTPPASPTPTATATATSTPRVPPTPRPRPTPYPRPTPP